jgi:uncharacterized protein YukE
MTAAPQATPVSAPASALPIAHASPVSSVDVGPVINAHEASLADYLNKPVHDILARFGIYPPPQAAPPNPNAGPPPGPAAPGPAAPGPAASAAPSTPFDPTQLIQPVTDALGTLGSGQFGNLDPTKMFDGISQALNSAGQSVQQAMSGLGGTWQGDAATAATAKTSDALIKGAEVSSQATDLRASLSTVTASVRQAEVRLIEIINEFFATLAAIGPNIVFPWGIAAAIEAATHAVTMSVEVITDTQTTLAAEAGQTATAGQPVAAVAAAPETGAGLASAAAPAASAATPGLGQAFGPLLQMATGLASPVMEGVSTVIGAVQNAAKTAPPGAPEDGKPADGEPGVGPTGGVPAGAGGPAGGGPGGNPPLRPPHTNAAIAGEPTTPPAGGPRVPSAPGMGGAPMMGGGPLAHAAKSSAGSGHNAASFLHTSDQGGEIVGDLGSVAPPVIGEMDVRHLPDIELRI